jgi:hypothetical protein
MGRRNKQILTEKTAEPILTASFLMSCNVFGCLMVVPKQAQR